MIVIANVATSPPNKERKTKNKSRWISIILHELMVNESLLTQSADVPSAKIEFNC